MKQIIRRDRTRTDSSDWPDFFINFPSGTIKEFLLENKKRKKKLSCSHLSNLARLMEKLPWFVPSGKLSSLIIIFLYYYYYKNKLSSIETIDSASLIIIETVKYRRFNMRFEKTSPNNKPTENEH